MRGLVGAVCCRLHVARLKCRSCYSQFASPWPIPPPGYAEEGSAPQQQQQQQHPMHRMQYPPPPGAAYGGAPAFPSVPAPASGTGTPNAGGYYRMAQQDVKPQGSFDAFSVLIDSFYRKGMHHEIEQVFRVIRASQVCVAAPTYRAFMDIYSQLCDFERMDMVYEEMKKAMMRSAGHHIPEQSPQQKLEASESLVSLLDSCYRRGLFHEVQQVYRAMKAAELAIPVPAYKLLIETYSQLKNWAEMDATYMEMKEAIRASGAPLSSGALHPPPWPPRYPYPPPPPGVRVPQPINPQYGQQLPPFAAGGLPHQQPRQPPPFPPGLHPHPYQQPLPFLPHHPHAGPHHPHAGPHHPHAQQQQPPQFPAGAHHPHAQQQQPPPLPAGVHHPHAQQQPPPFPAGVHHQQPQQQPSQMMHGAPPPPHYFQVPTMPPGSPPLPAAAAAAVPNEAAAAAAATTTTTLEQYEQVEEQEEEERVATPALQEAEAEAAMATQDVMNEVTTTIQAEPMDGRTEVEEDAAEAIENTLVVETMHHEQQQDDAREEEQQLEQEQEQEQQQQQQQQQAVLG